MSGNIRLQKPVEDNPETLEIHLNTDMRTVFADGLSSEDYFEMIDNVLAIQSSLTAHGSGCAVEKVNHLEVKTTKFTRVRGLTYFALTSDLQGLRSLLNIRNHRGNKCFL